MIKVIKVNNKELALSVKSVAELIASLKITTDKLAVVKNGKIVPRSQRENETLQDGDVIEIFSLVNGG